MKRYLVVVFLFISSACTREFVANDNLPTPFCAWRFMSQDYTSSMATVDASVPSSITFSTSDTIYPFNTLSYVTSAASTGTYPIGQVGVSLNNMAFHYSVSIDSVQTLSADSGMIHITSNTNSNINSNFIAIIGTDTLTGHCDNLKLN